MGIEAHVSMANTRQISSLIALLVFSGRCYPECSFSGLLEFRVSGIWAVLANKDLRAARFFFSPGTTDGSKGVKSGEGVGSGAS